MAELVPIPSPPGLPIIGNLGEFTTNPMADLARLADTYGHIYRVYLGSNSLIMASSNALINELCDEKRFHKTLKTVLAVVREGVHDGLFTAYDDGPNWSKAHRILTPAFGPLSIRGMFGDMHDIATQMCMKFARHGPQHPIHVAEDFTRLALDTLALCAMDFRFNSYYREDMHPFVEAMGSFLGECDNRQKRPAFAPNFLFRAANEKFFADIAVMRQQTADEVVESRKKNPSARKDLLSAMLDGRDPQTGEKLSDENITNQLITFLIAGHETTSGMLSFTFTSYSSIRQTFGVEANEDTVIGGKYLIRKGEVVSALLNKAHLDPVVYGEDANEFKPERMNDENFARLNKEFPNCWKPFGNGKRGCIGRPFAWQEAILVTAMLFQNFDFTMDDPNYQLQIKETLTLKPDNFDMRASLRHGMTATELEQRLAGKAPSHEEASSKKHLPEVKAQTTTGKPLAVYYGPNSGTCEALAQRLAGDAPTHGFSVTTIGPLDQAKQNVPQDHPVVIITASYEGQPPSNAAHFVNWMENLKGNEMGKVSYAVFACGHHDWTQTFHRIPKLVDSTLEKLGGTRLVTMGSADAASSDMFSDFETWEDETLWPALKEKYGTSETSDAQAGLIVEVTTPRKTTLRQDVVEALVISAKTLTASGPEKKHIEIQLPTGMSYKAARHVGVATSFLSELTPGDKLHVSVRPSTAAFHLPSDAENTPVICIAAGSGLAPFRGFIQERAAMLAAGRDLAPALLFFGCRDPDVDDLYARELARWEKLGAVEVRRAYSRATDRAQGCKYVQDRMYHDRKDIFPLWDRGARVYICGSREVGKGIEDVCIRLAQEWTKDNLGKEATAEEAIEWFEKNRNERFATDVFD
ncbi:hypothetical protein QQZ08_000802 [Neonectria magnoliae]|uniref:Flavodoxin-like domain-containing protein n=1 Tax=Neonectria magnoliae TaxID=2732573 RepID=A0ABR1IHD0_9HYPO